MIFKDNPLANLDYIKSNFPNVYVHYGDFKSLRIEKDSSAFLTQGVVQVYCKQKNRKWKIYTVPVPETAEIKNETNFQMYVKLNDSVLTDKNLTDTIIYIKLGEEKK